MELNMVKQYSLAALIGILVYSLLKLNLFVTQAQLEQQLRLLESEIRSEYATKHDISEIKTSISALGVKLDKLYENQHTYKRKSYEN